MKRLLIRASLLLPSFLVLSFSGISYAAAAAATCPATTTPSGQILQGAGVTGATCSSGTAVGTLAGEVVSVMGIIVGVVAVIMVMLGGFRYITSAGDSNKIASAKSTLIYAMIGLAIAALSETIVRYVLHTSAALVK